MKKQILITSLMISAIGTAVFAAGMTTEKDIGPCTAKNVMGFCSQSKTHYCASFGSNGRCRMWYSKSKSDFDNALEQFNAFNDGINEEIGKANAGKTTSSNKTNNVTKQKSPVTTSKVQTSNNSQDEIKFLSEEKNTIPNSIKISQSLKEIDSKIQYLQTRKTAGIDVENELKLLDYKSTKLWQLKNLRSEFSNIYSNYHSKIITKSEYEEMIAKLRKSDNELLAPYVQIMNTDFATMQKEEAETKAKIEAEQKKQRKKEIGRRLIEQGTLYVPPSASNWIRQGADALELLK